MTVSVSSLARLLREPVNAFIESQVAINRKTREIVDMYAQAPDLRVNTQYKGGTCTMKIPALTIAHVPSLSHKRMKVCMHVRTKRTCSKKKGRRTVFQLTNCKKGNSHYKISFTIEAAASSGLQHLQQHLSEQIASRTHVIGDSEPDKSWNR